MALQPMEAATGAGRASGAGLWCWLWEHHCCNPGGPKALLHVWLQSQTSFQEGGNRKNKEGTGLFCISDKDVELEHKLKQEIQRGDKQGSSDLKGL